MFSSVAASIKGQIQNDSGRFDWDSKTPRYVYNESDKVEIKCEVDGEPPPKVQWRRVRVSLKSNIYSFNSMFTLIGYLGSDQRDKTKEHIYFNKKEYHEKCIFKNCLSKALDIFKLVLFFLTLKIKTQ